MTLATPPVAQRPAAVQDIAHNCARYLPLPPDDNERDLYLGPQHRWVAPLSFVGYILIVISVSLFVMRRYWVSFLFIPLLVSTAGTVVSLLTASRRRRISLDEHRRKVADWMPDVLPSIDVFLPSAGEDLEILANTYTHIAQLEWPGDLSVYVLDDSARASVRELADSFGFRYLSRPDRGRLKKAGNLLFGYEHSCGDVIAVFDADFVPRRDYLFELAPYLDDPDVGIVQSPQFFDVHKTMNWLQRAAGATQILFYRWVQPSRDRSGAAICVGTSALYRRSALESAGGFAQIGHSEDVHTGVNLLAAGHQLRYVPTVVSKGTCPDSFNQFVTQQYRWCTGSMSLLFSRRFHRLDLTLMQRLCFWSGFLYYITTAVNVFVMVIPPIIMGYFAAGQVRMSNYVFVALALIVRQAIVPLITLDGESMLGLARIQTTYSFSHAVALWDVLRNRTDGWVATGAAGSSRTSTRVRLLAVTWFVSVQALLWGAIAWHAPQYGLLRYWPYIATALLNLYIGMPIALGQADFPWSRARRARARTMAATRPISTTATSGEVA